MSDRMLLAAQLVADQVVEILADKDSIPASQALSIFSKSALYARLLDPETELWHENPYDIAAMFEFESRGEDIPPEMYFK
jgi:hypothetical protein